MFFLEGSLKTNEFDSLFVKEFVKVLLASAIEEQDQGNCQKDSKVDL